MSQQEYPRAHLLGVPGETRNRIYDFLFYRDPEDNNAEPGQRLQLLRTCRQIHAEASPIAFKSARFTVTANESKLKASLVHMSEHQKSAVQEITFRVQPYKILSLPSASYQGVFVRLNNTLRITFANKIFPHTIRIELPAQIQANTPDGVSQGVSSIGASCGHLITNLRCLLVNPNVKEIEYQALLPVGCAYLSDDLVFSHALKSLFEEPDRYIQGKGWVYTFAKGRGEYDGRLEGELYAGKPWKSELVGSRIINVSFRYAGRRESRYAL